MSGRKPSSVSQSNKVEIKLIQGIHKARCKTCSKEIQGSIMGQRHLLKGAIKALIHNLWFYFQSFSSGANSGKTEMELVDQVTRKTAIITQVL